MMDEGDGRCCEMTRLCRTSSRRDIRLHSSQNGGRSKVTKNKSQSVRIYGDVFHDTIGQNRGQASKTRGSSRTNFERTLRLLASCGKDSLRRFNLKMNGKTELGMSIGSPKSGIVPAGSLCYKKKAGRKQNVTPTWKKLMKLVDPGEPTSFLD